MCVCVQSVQYNLVRVCVCGVCVVSPCALPCPLFPQNMESNWKNAKHTLTRIECHSENSKGVYCLQYDDKKIISGLRDNTIKVHTCALGY